MIFGDKSLRASCSPFVKGGQGVFASDGTRRCTNVVWFDLDRELHLLLEQMSSST
jgi:hypothetical protein